MPLVFFGNALLENKHQLCVTIYCFFAKQAPGRSQMEGGEEGILVERLTNSIYEVDKSRRQFADGTGQAAPDRGTVDGSFSSGRAGRSIAAS